jgi:hypothetical protein
MYLLPRIVVASITHTVDATMSVGCNHTAFYFVTLDATTYVGCIHVFKKVRWWMRPSGLVTSKQWTHGYNQTAWLYPFGFFFNTWMHPDNVVASTP